jgi:uncharacterized membrane protein
MTDQPPTQGSFFQQRPPEPVFVQGGDEQTLALVIYILYLIPIGITHIVGLVMAYVARDTAPEWLRSHYTLQIRTFWIGLLYFAIAGVLCVVLIGFALLPVVAVWFIVRCALGLVRLSQRQPYPNPQSWMI